MVGIEVVLGALIAWAVGKARRAGKTLDGVVDEVIDAGAAQARAKVLEVVLGKVGDDSAVKELEAEVAETGQVSELTRTRVELAVQAAQKDEAFAAQLKAAMAEAQRHGAVATHGGTVITGTATSTGSGDAIGAAGTVNKVQALGPQQPGRD